MHYQKRKESERKVEDDIRLVRKARVQRASRRAGRFSSALNSTHACAAKHTHPNHFWSTDLPQIWFFQNIAFEPRDNFERRYSQEISVTVKASRVLGAVRVFWETGRNRLLPRVSGGRGGEMSFDQIWQLGLQWSASHNGGIKEGWNMKRSRNVNSDLPGDLEKEFLWSDLLVGAAQCPVGTVEEGNEKGREWSTENEDQCDCETSESSSKDTRY